jgi:cytidylate kinase
MRDALILYFIFEQIFDMGKIIIAIDGHSGCGKSSTAKALARKLLYTHIDSGAMYRAVTLFFLKHKIDLQDEGEIKRALKKIHISFGRGEDGEQYIVLNGENVEKEIRSMEVSNAVSPVSALTLVREAMVALQRNLGANKGIIMDGRDIGTVVFPNAELKVFMTAKSGIRAKRRQKELQQSGKTLSLAEIEKNLLERDKIDMARENSPLRKAEDALVVDTSEMNFEDQVEEIYKLAKMRMNQNPA